MNDTPRKTTVTLEDLLRIKRAEQPPIEFWNQFEHGLRAKQLAAIVEPRPWWAPFIRLGARISRYQLPVGATAILAITFFTISEYQPASQNPAFEPMAERASVTPTTARVDGRMSAVDVASVPVVTTTNVAVLEPTPVNNPAKDTRVAQAAPVTAATALGAASHVAMVNSELTSAHYMAVKLADAQPTDPNLDQVLGRALRETDGGAMPSEPLAQLNVPGDSRLERWHGGVALPASIGSSDSALRVNEQTARRLTERRLSESDVISRLAVGGDRLTVKF